MTTEEILLDLASRVDFLERGLDLHIQQGHPQQPELEQELSQFPRIYCDEYPRGLETPWSDRSWPQHIELPLSDPNSVQPTATVWCGPEVNAANNYPSQTVISN